MARKARKLKEGAEIPMNFSFRRKVKGDGIMATRTSSELNARGERQTVVHDQDVNKAGYSPSGKSYGLFRSRPQGAPADQPRERKTPTLTADDRIRAKLQATSAPMPRPASQPRDYAITGRRLQ